MRVLGLVGAILVLAGCTLQRGVAQAPPSGKEGTTAPPLTGQTLGGQALGVNFAEGKTVLVFWAAWCGPCRHEQPGLNRIAADYAAKGVRLYGVDILDHDRAQARAFLQEFHVPYPSLYDSAGKLAAKFEVDAPPAIILVDGRGIIVGRVAGGISEDQLRRLIENKFLTSSFAATVWP